MLDKGRYRWHKEGDEIGVKIQINMEVIRNMKQSDNAFLGLGVKFPALVDAPGVAPWNPNQLDIW
ncbi:MAG: hypothetical protein KDA91_21790, partial [Planctomycetaceae bacterium]|nr:hypothetical protein [Planctomycetaceae bacterium]